MCEWSFIEASWLKFMVSACQRRVEWDPRIITDVVCYGKGSLLLFIYGVWSDQKVFRCHGFKTET